MYNIKCAAAAVNNTTHILSTYSAGLPIKLILSNPNMAPCKRQMTARRHLVCDHCHSLVELPYLDAGSLGHSTWMEGLFFSVCGIGRLTV